ncbi:MAG: O-antigen ligase family protein [Cytophagaceae bacterium]|nr:O-antigen ligase family protein [Cytophagaceae bacterium]
MKSEIGKIDFNKKLFLAFAIILLLSIGTAFYKDKLFILALPAIILFTFILFINYRLIYYLLILSVPVSIHYSFTGFSIDLPSEPLMLCFTLLFPVVFLLNHKQFNFLKHPVILLILVQLIWMIFCSFFSVAPALSIKYLFAKAWFIIPFVFFTCYFLQKPTDFKNIFWLFHLPLIIVCLYTLLRHSMLGFSFETANKPMNPFFHNHVLYSSTIAMFIPFVLAARNWYAKNSAQRFFINISLLIYIIAIAFSYTRASWLAVGLIIPVYFIMRLNMTKLALTVIGVMIAGSIIYFNYQNKYLEYAITYKSVVFHKGNIEKHLQATYEMKDVSGMERVYRWLAAQNMIKENPVVGTGPNTFYPEYKKYSINAFYTYVSDNPEKSTTHNYFLMIFCEQGFIGFVLFTILFIVLLIKVTNIYTASKNNEIKPLAMASGLSLFILLLHLMLNDLIETDKIGSLFFITTALIIKLDMWSKKEKESDHDILQVR